MRKCLYFVDLTTFQILGQNLSNFFVGILVETMTPKGHFEINWPLANPANQPISDKLPNWHFLTHACNLIFWGAKWLNLKCLRRILSEIVYSWANTYKQVSKKEIEKNILILISKKKTMKRFTDAMYVECKYIF